jgi:hypothetical protein
VALRPDSPDFRAEAQSVWEHLEDDVALRRPKSLVPQCRQTECVSGAVSEIEPAVQRVGSFSASFSRASPERTRPRNSLASGDSFATALPGPARRSSGDGEVILGSNHPEFWLLEHPRHERVFCPGPD